MPKKNVKPQKKGAAVRKSKAAARPKATAKKKAVPKSKAAARPKAKAKASPAAGKRRSGSAGSSAPASKSARASRGAVPKAAGKSKNQKPSRKMGTWAARGMARAEKFPFNRAGPDSSSSSTPQDFSKSLAIRRVGREAILNCQAAPAAERPRMLKKLSKTTLKSMEEFLLYGVRAGGQALPGKEPSFADKGLNSRSLQLAGVMVDKNDRYSVEVSWDGLRFRTQKTRFSEEVIDWHISLTQMKAKAQSRIRKAEAEGRHDEESYYPLTESELLDGYKTSPTMRLSFLSQHLGGHPPIRCVTPCTHHLSQALEFKKRFAETFEKYGKIEKPTIPFADHVHKLKKDTARLAGLEKLEREQTDKQLLQEVNAEISTRGEVELAVEGEEIPEEVSWHDQAKVAMEIRDLLQLDHANAQLAAATLRGMTIEQREAVKMSILEPMELEA
eukprot:CAMPEP_0197654844 /NCGR_PEP_ID=MMETSP1338-20131121/39093_1 /TAXON_ID=43686 ORGANISM="Pelagodinium beii, Strain RCC1491" /NCGR_SAMPLE_ID=MMETSP1338 /ASSEMBLY_ACC=CAM_ASM_000754 /LENGTH=443 /DNA_ID=CAMNT_0043230365 /DNA_START=43 /DNA_END=1374 /DNA_ORIENTATION=+